MGAATSSVDKHDVAEESWRFTLWNYAHIMSGGKWIPYPALVYVANIIQDAIRRGGGRIIINFPPRHGKSELVSRWLPTWFLDWFPHLRIILAAYGGDFAAGWGRKVRDEFKYNPKTWTGVNKGHQAIDDWGTHCVVGGMRTAGSRGPIIGTGGDLIILDDPYKSRAEVNSPTIRKRTQDWFDSDVYSRLEPNATIIIIMQRMREDDLTGYLINEHEDDWTHICFPAVAEEGDVLGRDVGTALIPERYDEEALHQIMRAVGSNVWACRYQQRPAPAEGNIIERDWFNYFMRYPEDIKKVVISWDMSFKKEGKSWCVGQVWYPNGANHYLLHQERGRWGFTTALKKTIALREYAIERWGSVHEVLIEEAANGYAIINTIKDEVPGVIPVKTGGLSKPERLSNTAPIFEAGQVHVPDKSIAPWVDGLVEEVVTIPNAQNDDQGDALSQYLNRYKNKSIGAIKLNLGIGIGQPTWRLS